MNKKILIVEDQFIEANNLQMILERAGYQVCTIARSVHVAVEIIPKEKPDLVLLDIYLKGNLTGIDLAKELNKIPLPFVYLSANSNQETLDAAKATKPYGFLVKPFREKDVLVMLDIADYLHRHNQQARLQQALIEPPAATLPTASPGNRTVSTPQWKKIIGESGTLQQVLHHAAIVAPQDTSVLILGESGTGKERIADYIQQLSPRSAKPLVKVNCAALPANLVESELFGHERGAFTGAAERRVGKFELAQGGTIFLDEIGEMPPELQVKLLRVLQEKEIERVGGKSTIKVNVRIVAATNRHLEKEVAEGRFRMDLYYRLNVFPLLLPPLRERKDDIPALATYFMQKFAAQTGKNITAISAQVLKVLTAYDWPGNIRELENCIERAVIISPGNTITDATLPVTTQKLIKESSEAGGVKTMDENERDNILAALKKSNGRVFGPGGAADLLGIHASTLNSKMKKLGIVTGKVFTGNAKP